MLLYIEFSALLKIYEIVEYSDSYIFGEKMLQVQKEKNHKCVNFDRPRHEFIRLIHCIKKSLKVHGVVSIDRNGHWVECPATVHIFALSPPWW